MKNKEAMFVFVNPRRRYSRLNIWRYINPVIPPIGLAVLAATLEEQGVSVQIIDAHAEQLSDIDILKRVGNPLYIGITSTTPEIGEAKRLSKLFRESLPRTKIIMGGVHPTVEHVALIEDGSCDAVVRGEGELPVTYIAQGVHWSDVPSLTWRDEQGNAVVNPDGGVTADIDKSPFPAYHLLPMHKYRPALGAAKRSPAMGIITSRGCPGGCNFCVSGSNPEKTRYVSPERVIEHIVFLQERYGVKEILFYDDTFTGSRHRVEEICRLIIDKGLDVSWVCFARVDTVTPDLLSLLKQAGCHQISYGIESPDAGTLALMNKRINVTKVQQAVCWAQAAGLDVRGAFMLGSPGETVEAMHKTIGYAIDLGIDYAMFNITTPFPGTRLYEQSESEGWLEHRDWKRYDLSQPVLNLPTASRDQVKAAYGRAYLRFYLRPKYFLSRLGLRKKGERVHSDRLGIKEKMSEHYC